MPFEIVRNDITKMHVDAIVNAANNSLLGGGGVDGAIHRAAGPELLEECRTLGGCETGKAKITRGYRLPAKYVIHTVGPIWNGGGYGERALLESCYRNSLELASAHGCETVAFPMISAGAYGYPKEEAMEAAAATITAFLADHDMTVYLVVFGSAEFLAGKKLFREIREFIDDIYAEQHIQHNVEYARGRLWHSSRKAAQDMDIALGQSIQEEETEELLLPAASCPDGMDLPELLKRTDEGFSARLLRLIDEKGITDAECYKRANVDRKLFSKIRSNPEYKPGRTTAYAFALALELNLRETKDLLRRAGFAMTRSSKFDIVMEYCIRNRRYNVLEINEVLFQLDMPLLGSGMNS